MSYFCANSISIDKTNDTFKVKGGDNNVVPRSNYWSNYAPLSELLYDISSGCVQFTTRSDKHLYIESIVDKYNKKLRELTGLSTYDLADIIRKGQAVPIANYKEAIARYQAPDSHMSDAWTTKQVAKLTRLIEIADNDALVEQIEDVVAEFVAEVKQPVNLEKNCIVTVNGNYVYKANPRSVRLTRQLADAMKMPQLKAQRIAENYRNAEILQVTA